MRKNVYIGAGYNTIFFGSGRKEFSPNKPMPPFEQYLLETAKNSCNQINNPQIDEGFIGSFMSAQFIKQANLPGFLPFMIPSLRGKACTGIEGACGTGGRAIAMGMRSILSDVSDVVFVSGFEMQNTMKAIYGADLLAGAAYYRKERKQGEAFFFPGLFSERAGAYYQKYGYENSRKAMAHWYEQAIINARKNPHAQEYHNQSSDLYSLGMKSPNPENFVPHLNPYDCSKVSDGASSLILMSEEGRLRSGLNKDQLVEIIAFGEAEEDITLPPSDLLELSTTKLAVEKALKQANLTLDQIGVLEIHDCFSITAILAFEALGFVQKGKGCDFILEGNASLLGKIPTNLSGGLIGFGHPTGATGVRQMVDLWQQLTGIAPNQAKLRTPYGMMVSMGGNDKTVTAFIVKRA